MLSIAATGPSFLSNHKYNYAVEGLVKIYLTGSEKQETSVKLTSQVSVAAQGNCGYVLRVQNLQISGPDGKVETVYYKFSIYFNLFPQY